MNWHDIAYKENTLEGSLAAKGYDENFIEWFIEESYAEYHNGLMIHTPSKKLFTIKEVEEKYKQLQTQNA